MNPYIEFPKLGLKFNIDRVAFAIGNKEVYWYGIIIAFGLVLAIVVGLPLAKRKNVTSDNIFDIVLWGLPSAVICARLYYVIFQFDQYKNNLSAVFEIWNGGIAIYGAVIGAVISTYIYCRAKKLDFLVVADFGSIGLIIGQIVGRWGNFVNQEAFGANTNLPWGMTGSEIISELEYMKSLGMAVDPAMPVHPTFLYESLWNLCVLGILFLIYFKMHKFNGQVFLSYLTLYGLGRFWIEGLRTDSLYWGSFRVSQVLALVCVIVGAVVMAICLKRTKNVDHTSEEEKNSPENQIEG